MKKFFLSLSYLLLGLPLGILYFTVLVTGFSLGAGLLVTLIGIPILGSMIFITYTLADMERFFTFKLLGIQIAKPEARPSKSNSARSILVAQVGNPGFWKQFLYLLFKLPLGTFSFMVAITFVTMSLALLSAPLLITLDPTVSYIHFGNWQVDSMGEALLCSLAGLALGVVSVPTLNGLSSLLGRLTNWTLGKK